MDSTVNSRVLSLKNQLNLSDVEFCVKAGISTGTLHRIKNEASISTKIINSLVLAFGVSRKWLVDGEGELEISSPTIESKQSGLQKAVEVLESKVEHLEEEIQFYRQLLLSNAQKVAANFNEAFGLAGHEIEGKLQGKVVQMFAESVRVRA